MIEADGPLRRGERHSGLTDPPPGGGILRRVPGRVTSPFGEGGMGKVFAELDDDLRAFIARQHVFLVATAPLSPDGRVNVSPKGLEVPSAVTEPTAPSSLVVT